MSIGALLNVGKTIGAPLLLKGLEKLNPKFKNFFTQAAAYGYSTDQALSYLTERFSPNSQFKNQLEKGVQQGTLRPDEQVARQQMKTQEIPGKVARSALAFGGAGLAALGEGNSDAGSQQQPQQDQQQSPEESYDPNAMGPSSQGIQGGSPSSLSSSINSQIQDAKFRGGSPSEMSESINAQMAKSGPGGFLNFISQHPELGSFLDQAIGKGLSPREASMKAKGMRKFKNTIADIESQIGQPFEDLLEQLFQGSKQQQAQRQQAAPQDQQMNGDSALIAALDKILKM